MMGGRFPRSGVYVSLALPLLALAAVGLMAKWWPIKTEAAAVPHLALRTSPIFVQTKPRPCVSIPEEDMSKIRAQVEPSSKAMSASLYLHALRVFGRDSKYSRAKLATSGETLRLFADDAFSKQILGTPLMVRTPFGIRCTPEGSAGIQESHRDYCLAVLSEQKPTASFSMVVGGKAFTLKDFLADSIANFHLGQEEIEWTALTYAVWIPPERKWTNKFGEVFSFDDLATELMRRPLDKAVCAGCHVAQAMTVLARVDHEVCPILTPEVRGELTRRLGEMVQDAEAAQSLDGSWSPDWHEKHLKDSSRDPKRKGWSEDTRSLGKRLLATSHVSEWLMLLPEEFRVSDDRFERAGRWLHAQLKGVDSHFVGDNFCACCHGAIVLQLVRDTAGAIAVDQSREAVSVSGHQVHQRKRVR